MSGEKGGLSRSDLASFPPPPGFSLRFVREAPVQAVVDLYQAGGWWEESDAARAAIPRIVRGSHAFAIAVEDATGRVVGMGRVISDGVSDGYVQDLAVLKEFRRMGIGQALAAALVKRCVDDGLGWVGVVCAPGTEGFYDTMGFLRRMPGFHLRLLASPGTRQ